MGEGRTISGKGQRQHGSDAPRTSSLSNSKALLGVGSLTSPTVLEEPGHLHRKRSDIFGSVVPKPRSPFNSGLSPCSFVQEMPSSSLQIPVLPDPVQHEPH